VIDCAELPKRGEQQVAAATIFLSMDAAARIIQMSCHCVPGKAGFCLQSACWVIIRARCVFNRTATIL
jgi:hypothetical protein